MVRVKGVREYAELRVHHDSATSKVAAKESAREAGSITDRIAEVDRVPIGPIGEARN